MLSASPSRRVLLLLRDGPKHGYELLERLPELSAGDGHIDLGNLYRLLRALEAEGLVSSAVAGRVPVRHVASTS